MLKTENRTCGLSSESRHGPNEGPRAVGHRPEAGGAAAEMQERVDINTPIGLNDAVIKTFHGFGDEVFREFALELGRSGELRVLSSAEQVIFVREHLYDLPLRRYRPAGDPLEYVRALLDLFGRAR